MGVLQSAPDTLGLLWADVKQTVDRNKHFPRSVHGVETLDFLGSLNKTHGKEFLQEIGEILEEFPVSDVYWSDD